MSAPQGVAPLAPRAGQFKPDVVGLLEPKHHDGLTPATVHDTDSSYTMNLDEMRAMTEDGVGVIITKLDVEPDADWCHPM